MIGFKLQVQSYFGFLATQLQFNGPVYYSGREDYGAYFFKHNIVVDISLFGKCRVFIYKIKANAISIKDATNEVKPIESRNVIQSYNVEKLDFGKKLWNSVSNDNFPDKDFWYNLKLINRNPSILDGNFKPFTLIHRLWKYLVPEK